ncbi:hypothetical protein [Castellaniella sp.]|uniref:hypothetical protein n=1 Tax=Castellaniella sp. TaxID=1955812 RepID=UPI002AFE2069|nr:hypothetical protein [Castellaniella sp.]
MADEVWAQREALGLLQGTQISYGSARTVYACKLFSDCVIKVEDGAGSFQNVMEWETWQRVKDTKFAKWFAPCEFISPAGGILVMKRTMPIDEKRYPQSVPAFFTDLKYANYGMLDGQFVCHDYGVSLLMENGMSERMRKPEWWK